MMTRPKQKHALDKTYLSVLASVTAEKIAQAPPEKKQEILSDARILQRQSKEALNGVKEAKLGQVEEREMV